MQLFSFFLAALLEQGNLIRFIALHKLNKNQILFLFFNSKNKIQLYLLIYNLIWRLKSKMRLSFSLAALWRMRNKMFTLNTLRIRR